MKKKIIVINHASTFTGGCEMSFFEFVSLLHKDDNFNIKVALPSYGELNSKFKKNNISVDVVKDESWRFWYRTKTQLIMFFLTFYKLIPNLILWISYFKTQRPSLIHINISRIIIPLIAAKIMGVSTIIHFRDVPNAMRYKPTMGWYLFYRIMNFSNHWIANSSATRKDVLSNCINGKVTTLFNFLDIKTFDKNAQNFPTKENYTIERKTGYKIAMLGAINPWKNQMDFIKIAIKILKIRKDITFYMYGKILSENYYSKLKCKIKDSGLEKHIIFGGFNKNTPNLFKYIDLIVHTTKTESFGRIFIESLAAKVPVITFNSGGAVDIITDKSSGLLINDFDLDKIVVSIEDLIDNDKLRLEMGKNGRTRVKKLFSSSIYLKKLNHIYLSLITE